MSRSSKTRKRADSRKQEANFLAKKVIFFFTMPLTALPFKITSKQQV